MSTMKPGSLSKKCTVCKKTKLLTEYYIRGDKRGLRSECITCNNASTKKNHDRVGQREVRLTKKISLKYDLTLPELSVMLNLQGGKCAICDLPITNAHYGGEGRRLIVDHCHATGDVRGLLCGQCNSGIGLLGDNPDLCKKAEQYLRGVLDT